MRATINPFNFFGFFTVQSNIILVVVLLVASIESLSGRRRSRSLMVARGCATTYMVITGVVYNVLLAGLEGGVSLAWANSVLHIIGGGPRNPSRNLGCIPSFKDDSPDVAPAAGVWRLTATTGACPLARTKSGHACISGATRRPRPKRLAHCCPGGQRTELFELAFWTWCAGERSCAGC